MRIKLFLETREASVNGYLYYPFPEIKEHLGYFLLSGRLRDCVASTLIVGKGVRSSSPSSTISETAPR